MSEFELFKAMDEAAFGGCADSMAEDIEVYLEGHDAYLEARAEELAEDPVAKAERYAMCRELLDREEQPRADEATSEAEAALHFLLWKVPEDERADLLQRYVESPINVQAEFELTYGELEHAVAYGHLDQE